MAAVELKGFVCLIVGISAVARVKHIAGKCLDCGRRQYRGEFGDVSTALGSREALLDAVAKTLEEVEPDQLAVVRTDGIAMTGIGYRVRNSLGSDDIELGVDGKTQPQIVYRCAGRLGAGGELDLSRLGVRDMRVEIPQAVVARVRFDLDCACVLQRTAGSRRC